jgi:photosystem II stability/assembly factor-like uncharacterized protein
MRSRLPALVMLALAAPALLAAAARPKPAAKGRESTKDEKAEAPKGLHSADTWSGLELRPIGPALTSGRVVDIAVDPKDPRRWFVAAAAGGVWLTTNAGTTWAPVFEKESSWSIGTVLVDPHDSNVIWVGSGENNSQRSVGFGDGVYRSEDGGKSFDNVGLAASEHIGRIVVHPKDPRTVYVAAQGPLWSAGGDRGLYKTTDGGRTWARVLHIGEHTGVSEVVLDPRDPETLYAVAYQRRRHVWTLIDGGPDSGLHKSTDGGRTWKKLTSGLPKEDMGRIGIAISPVDPDVLYAIVESTGKAGGFFRSEDRGATWEKRSDYVSSSPQYYQELFADLVNRDRVYSMDDWLRVSDDGGRTWRQFGESNKHIDNHALWQDPQQPAHFLVGCDGGIYETFDRAATWDFKANLPLTQFYKITVDDAAPIYNVYGGTQDNFTLGGPSRTRNVHGIANSDWFVTLGGDGFQPRVEPGNPDIVYSQWQHGALSRMDRRTGEAVYIQPQAAKGGEALRWNWDSPFIISPHAPTRLYFAAQRLYRSDDRGDSWRAVSPDLTRGVDRNKLKVMGRVWPADAVAKNASTSFFGNIVALAESPKVDGLLYVGTDDGLVQVSADGGATWRREQTFPGVPDMTYVSRLTASLHGADTVYAAFNNHKMGDFKPYLLKSTDRGTTWTSIAGDLPERGSVWAVEEDHVDPSLLFVGTEFGVFFTRDGGQRWIQLKGNFPTIAVRDLAIQRRENDLVVGTFGRGMYVLDDYTPLRAATAADFEKEAHVFPARPGRLYVPTAPLGLRGRAFMGDSYYVAPNPPYGVTFTYHLKEGLKTLRERRQEAEKKAVEKGQDPAYPTLDQFRSEAAEEAPALFLAITDASGATVRRVNAPLGAGVHRVAWDLRWPAATPAELEDPKIDNPFEDPPSGPLAVPGSYTATLVQRVGGTERSIAGPVTFRTDGHGDAQQHVDRVAFLQKTARLQRAVQGAVKSVEEATARVQLMKRALADTPRAEPASGVRLREVEAHLRELRVVLSGDQAVARRHEPTPPSISDRVDSIVQSHWNATVPPSGTSRTSYDLAAEEFASVLARLRTVIEGDLRTLEQQLEQAGAPWTPGRIPTWSPE